MRQWKMQKRHTASSDELDITATMCNLLVNSLSLLELARVSPWPTREERAKARASWCSGCGVGCMVRTETDRGDTAILTPGNGG
jgi:predicted molibdopterin-dependent oxidoreductase YjgC